MASEHEIRPGAKVIAEHGATLGQVTSVEQDPASGEPTTFRVKSGFWIFAKEKEVSVDVIRQVNNDPDTIVVELSKRDSRALPEREPA